METISPLSVLPPLDLDLMKEQEMSSELPNLFRPGLYFTMNLEESIRLGRRGNTTAMLLHMLASASYKQLNLNKEQLFRFSGAKDKKEFTRLTKTAHSKLKDEKVISGFSEDHRTIRATI